MGLPRLSPQQLPITARRHVASHCDQSPALGLESLPRPFFLDAPEPEEHYANVANACARDKRVMNAKGQNLPPQALADRWDRR